MTLNGAMTADVRYFCSSWASCYIITQSTIQASWYAKVDWRLLN